MKVEIFVLLTSPTPSVTSRFVDKTCMQHRLFAELSQMFGREVPLYDKSLLVNRVCNRTVASLLEQIYEGFQLTEDQLDKTSGERHGAIRIGTPEEYRWVAGFFAAFNLLPHNFYDMTTLGGKSQPIIATAFRSPINPEHRVFCSLLMVDNFTPEVRRRVEELLAKRQVFSNRAKELVLKSEEQGGLEEADAEELVREGTERIFKWTAQAHDYDLYRELCDSGYKIAADIACFESHHLNHLTPNTFCMDLYTSAMKFCMGELEELEFTRRALKALGWLTSTADADYMNLHFRHLTLDEIKAYKRRDITAPDLEKTADDIINRLKQPDLDLTKLNHSGFKDFTEGPAVDTPVLLRQDSYKALTEPVVFHEEDGTTVDAVHTARFGEIEQRFYATTPAGRTLYDRCLANADAAREKTPGLAKQDYDAYLEMYAEAFAPFPKTLPDLLDKKLVYGRYSVVDQGSRVGSPAPTADIDELVRLGYVQCEGLRYEDFLPFSAAGIFASNLGQYGTESGAAEKPTYSKETLEKIMGRKIIDPNIIYAGIQAESLLEVCEKLGLSESLAEKFLLELRETAAAYRSLLS